MGSTDINIADIAVTSILGIAAAEAMMIYSMTTLHVLQLVIVAQLLFSVTCASIPALNLKSNLPECRRKNYLAFTASRLEEEERRKGPGSWVDQKEIHVPSTYDDDYEDEYEDEYEDAIEDNVDFEDAEIPNPTWKRKIAEGRPSTTASNNKEQEYEQEYEEEHPMRTDEWLIKVRLSPLLFPGHSEADLFPDMIYVDSPINTNISKRISKKDRKKKHQVMKFSKNGYVILVEHQHDSSPSNNNAESSKSSTENTQSGEHEDGNSGDKYYQKQRVTKIGKWKIDTSGVSWSIPVVLKSKDSISNQRRTTLHYHADIHLSKFQDRPRMFRGVVTRDRFEEFTIPSLFSSPLTIQKGVFRPVIATFTAEGVGKDTVDVSYKERGFGLNAKGTGVPTE